MRHTLRLLKYIIEAAAAIAGIAIIIGLIVAWRLSEAPMTADMLTPYLKAGIETAISGSTASVGNTLIEWDKSAQSVSLSASDISVEDKQKTRIISIPSFKAKISLIGLVFGQFIPSDLLIDKPTIKIVKKADGSFVFGEMSVNAKTSQPKDSSAQSLGTTVDNIAKTLSNAALLRKMAISGAAIDIYEEPTGKTRSISIPEISIERSSLNLLDRHSKLGALSGKISLELGSANKASSIALIYGYDPSKHEHSISSSLKDINPSSIAGDKSDATDSSYAGMIDLPLSGSVQAKFDQSFSLAGFALDIKGGQGQLKRSELWDKPCPVKSLNLMAFYDKDQKKLSVSKTNIDFNGPVLSLDVSGKASAHQGQDIDYSVQLKVDNMPMNRYAEIWPKPILPNPRYWIEPNMRDGVFNHAEVYLDGYFALNDIANAFISDGKGKISASGGRVTYVDGMPPVENVSAEATFDLKSMSVKILRGNIGNIVLSPFTILISDLDKYDQYIDIPLQVAGPIPEVLKLLDNKPLEYAKALGIKPNDISGNMSGSVSFKFPLLKTLEMKDLKINAKADATAVASNNLVPGIPIEQGDLKLTLDTSGLDITGKTLLGKAPFNIIWRENFEKIANNPVRKAKIVGEVHDNQWKNIGIDYFKGTKGIVKVALDMTKPEKDQTIIAGDLDLSPAELSVKILNWKKPASEQAKLKFTASFTDKSPVEISDILLKGSKVSAKGKAVFSNDMSKMLSLQMPSLQIGRTNASISIIKPPLTKGAAKTEAKGKSLDISGMKGGEEEEHEVLEPQTSASEPAEYRIQVEQLYTGQNGVLTNAKGFAIRDKEGWKAIDLRGLADRDVPVTIEMAPKKDGTTSLAINCEDFGVAMKGLGFTDTIKGGRFYVYGNSSKEEPRTITGSLKISDFTVENLPVLALLLNATSPFGFTGILTDSADFSRLKGEFKLQNNTLTLIKTHAAGSAIGINTEGKIDLDTGYADLHGTLVPFSVMNKIINYIPIIGDIITGGKDEGVLAVSYQIEGPLSSPDVSVNPISLLTPGFLRNLFFKEETTE